jgi:hypothetical protein
VSSFQELPRKYSSFDGRIDELIVSTNRIRHEHENQPTLSMIPLAEEPAKSSMARHHTVARPLKLALHLW